MKNKIISVIFFLMCSISFAEYKFDTYKISNVVQVGKSDNSEINNAPLKTNVYWGHMTINKNGKTAIITVGYTLNENNADETHHNPPMIIIGNIVENIKGSSVSELEKLKIIDLPQEEFEKNLRHQFKNVYFL